MVGEVFGGVIGLGFAFWRGVGDRRRLTRRVRPGASAMGTEGAARQARLRAVQRVAAGSAPLGWAIVSAFGAAADPCSSRVRVWINS